MKNTNIPLEERQQIINEVIWACLHKQNYSFSEAEVGSLWSLLKNIFNDSIVTSKYWTYTRIKTVQYLKKEHRSIYNSIAPWVEYHEEEVNNADS